MLRQHEPFDSRFVISFASVDLFETLAYEKDKGVSAVVFELSPIPADESAIFTEPTPKNGIDGHQVFCELIELVELMEVSVERGCSG